MTSIVAIRWFREAYLLHHALRRAQQRPQNLRACRAPLLAPARTAHVKEFSIPVSPHELRHQRRLRRVRCAAPVLGAACQLLEGGEATAYQQRTVQQSVLCGRSRYVELERMGAQRPQLKAPREPLAVPVDLSVTASKHGSMQALCAEERR